MSYETRHYYHQPIRVDWQKLMLNLRSSGVTSRAIKSRIGMDLRTAQRMISGEIKEPRFSTGVELLKLHMRHCPELHEAEVWPNA